MEFQSIAFGVVQKLKPRNSFNSTEMVIKCYKVTLVIHETYATQIYARKKRDWSKLIGARLACGSRRKKCNAVLHIAEIFQLAHFAILSFSVAIICGSF